MPDAPPVETLTVVADHHKRNFKRNMEPCGGCSARKIRVSIVYSLRGKKNILSEISVHPDQLSGSALLFVRHAKGGG